MQPHQRRSNVSTERETTSHSKHQHRQCDRKKSYTSRYINCSRTSHTLKECKSKNICYDCKGKHHSSICNRSETAQSYGGASPVLGTAMRKSNGHIRSGPAAYQTVQARTGGKSAEFCLMVVVENRASVENMAENWLLNQYDQRIA